MAKPPMFGKGLVWVWVALCLGFAAGHVLSRADRAQARAQFESMRSEFDALKVEARAGAAAQSQVAALESELALARSALADALKEAPPNRPSGPEDSAGGASSPAVAAAALPVAASEIPPALTEYMGRMIAPAMSYHGGASWLLRRLREEEEKTSLLLPELRFAPGQTVCDLGCGNGYHVLMMAPLVLPGGTVIGVDIQQEMLDDLEKRAAQAGVKNLKTIRGEVYDPKLPPDSCDLILLADVYHEFSHPEPMLAALRAALKPDGVVALLEFRGEDPDVPIRPEHKMTKDQIRKEWEANGFVLDREFDGLPWQHLMFWKRK